MPVLTPTRRAAPGVPTPVWTILAAITATVLAVQSLLALSAPAEVRAGVTSIWINEIHYDDASGDSGEFVEVAGPAGLNLTGYSIELYNGNGGALYATYPLSGTLTDQQGGFGTAVVLTPGIQNGPPDGLALVSGTSVIQFLSYEGSFTATGTGTATGMTSTDIGVSEPGDVEGQSLQLQGTGTEYADFTWAGQSDDTPGAVNTGQTFGTPNAAIVLDCGAGITTTEGVATTGTVTASDADGTVVDIALASPPLGVTEVSTPETEDPTPAAASATVTVAATTAPGTYNITVTATNADVPTPQTGTCTLVVTVTAVDAPVLLDCGPDLATLEGYAVTGTVTASDEDGTVDSIVITDPATLPTGIAFDVTPASGDGGTATGTLTIGTTTGPGTYTFTLAASNDDDPEQTSDPCDIAVTVYEDGIDIHTIQGAQHISDYDGDAVDNVDGIVTAVSGNGFWMSDPKPDADIDTSEGIFVFRGSGGSKPQVGDHVLVDGIVDEFRAGGSGGENLTLTELVGGNALTFIVLSKDNALPVQIVGAGGRTPPTSVIHPGSPTGSVEDPAAGFDAVNRGLDFKESLEGMYVRLVDPVVVGPENNFGETAVHVDDGVNGGPDTPRGGVLLTPTDANPENIILDEFFTGVTTPPSNVGDEFTSDIFAVVDYSFGNFKFLVTASPARVDNGLAREVTADPATGELVVATFNVENLAGTSPQSKYDALASIIVNNLRAPDLLGIEEVQDDDGAAAEGNSDATVTWTRLIASIVAAGGPTYEYRQINPVPGQDGGQPGGNIRVGFLFRTDRGLDFVDRPGGTPTNETEITGTDEPHLTFSPGRIGSDDREFFETRKSLAGEFTYNGETFIAVVNHFSSKGDDDALYGRWQPPTEYTAFANPDPATETHGWRWGQAQLVNNFVDAALAVDADANVIVLGDINDFQWSTTTRILQGLDRDDGTSTPVATGEGAVLTPLTDLLAANERYGYIFEGNSQILDQILVTAGVMAESPVYDIVHVNSEFADQVSDHDPSLVRIAFGAASPPPSGSPSASPSPSPTGGAGGGAGTATPTPTPRPLPDTAVGTGTPDGAWWLTGLAAVAAALMVIGRARPAASVRRMDRT